MVNATVTTAAEAERALAIGYAPASRRAGLAALFSLDARLGEVVRTTRESLVGQMRLVWWRDALTQLDRGVPPAEPLLAALAADALPLGAVGAGLATMAEGWERLLDDPLGADAMTAFARERGAALFQAAAQVLGGEDRDLRTVGEGWALADLAARLRDPAQSALARTLAGERLGGSMVGRWPRALRPLGALVLLARDDLAGGQAGSPRRVVRLLAHRLTGL